MAAVEPHRLPGSAGAAALLYERHYARILSYCRWRLGRCDDAEDAAQTTFLDAYRGLRRGASPTAEVPWLLAIANNVCIARWRTERRRPPELAQAAEAFAAFAAPEHDPDVVEGLHDALAVLPEQQRRAFLLREWQGCSYAEIAEATGSSEAAVASRVFRARQALVDALGERRRTAGVREAGYSETEMLKLG